jgi:hypothetical protein
VTFAITAGPVAVSASASAQPFVSAQAGDKDIWIGETRVSTQDLSTLETVDLGDWGAGTSTSANPTYDRINDAILTRGTLESDITMRLLHRHGGYRVSGPIYANQEFLEVEEMFAAAVGGNIITHEGSVLLEPGQAKSVVETFTDDDLLIGEEATWNGGFLSESSSEWVNTIVANYIEPDQKWNPHNAPVLRDDDDIIADGRPREAQITLRLVRYLAQAMRVGEINRRLGRLGGRGSVKLGPRFCQLEAGDWVAYQSDLFFGGATKTLQVLAADLDEKWQIALSLREIAATVYADDADFPSDQSQPTTTPPPPDIGEPGSADWALAATTLDSAGASVPALKITGAVPDDENAEAVIVEYWLSDGVTDPTADPDAVPWIMVGTLSARHSRNRHHRACWRRHLLHRAFLCGQRRAWRPPGARARHRRRP